MPALQRAFDASLFALEQALARQAELDKEILALADTEPYRTPVGWLRCFRGIDTLSWWSRSWTSSAFVTKPSLAARATR